MEPRITLVTLGVSNFDRSLAFYRDGLQFPVYEQMEEFALFELDRQFLGLYPRDRHAEGAGLDQETLGTGDISLAHNVRTSEEVDELMAEAEAAGAEVTKPAEETEWGGYSGYFRDPDGHLWEVASGASFAEQYI